MPSSTFDSRVWPVAQSCGQICGICYRVPEKATFGKSLSDTTVLHSRLSSRKAFAAYLEISCNLDGESSYCRTRSNFQLKRHSCIFYESQLLFHQKFMLSRVICKNDVSKIHERRSPFHCHKYYTNSPFKGHRCISQTKLYFAIHVKCMMSRKCGFVLVPFDIFYLLVARICVQSWKNLAFPKEPMPSSNLGMQGILYGDEV